MLRELLGGTRRQNDEKMADYRAPGLQFVSTDAMDTLGACKTSPTPPQLRCGGAGAPMATQSEGGRLGEDDGYEATVSDWSVSHVYTRGSHIPNDPRSRKRFIPAA